MTKRRTCLIVAGRRPRFCSYMLDALAEDVNANTRGLLVVETTNVVTFKKRTLGVAYKVSGRDRGTFIHVCPWCGADLLVEFAADAMKRALADSRKKRR